MLSVGSTGTTTASDAHPARYPLPGSSPVIGRDAPTNSLRVDRAGEGLSSSRRHHPSVRAPYAEESFTAALPGSTPFPWPSPSSCRARLSLSPTHHRAGCIDDAAGFTSRYGPYRCSPANQGLSTLGFDPARFDDAASLLPGS